MFAIPSHMARFKATSPQAAQPAQPTDRPTGSLSSLPAIPIRLPAPRKAILFTLPKEPEDADITGGTRSLDRRLLALNLAGTLSKAHADLTLSPASSALPDLTQIA